MKVKMSKEHAEAFLSKVDMEGLSYAVGNYAPKDTGDERFDSILYTFQAAHKIMEAYIEELREKYDIAVCYKVPRILY